MEVYSSLFRNFKSISNGWSKHSAIAICSLRPSSKKDATEARIMNVPLFFIIGVSRIKKRHCLRGWPLAISLVRVSLLVFALSVTLLTWTTHVLHPYPLALPRKNEKKKIVVKNSNIVFNFVFNGMTCHKGFPFKCF